MTDEQFHALCEANSFGAVARGECALIPRGLLKALVDAAEAADRERCAKLCDEVAAKHRATNYGEFPGPELTTTGESGAEDCAAEIRRGPIEPPEAPK